MSEHERLREILCQRWNQLLVRAEGRLDRLPEGVSLPSTLGIPDKAPQRLAAAKIPDPETVSPIGLVDAVEYGADLVLLGILIGSEIERMKQED